MDENHSAEVPLVYEPEIIRGLKLLRRVKVDAGTAKVVTLDGAYQETLWPGKNWLPGGYWLGRYMPLTECKIYTVDTKDKQLTVEAENLTIRQPTPIKASLEVIVSYRVSLPHLIALQVSTPLQRLRSWTVEAMHEVVSRLDYADFLDGGRAAADIFQYLNFKDVEQDIGLQIFNVQINKPDTPLPLNPLQILRESDVINNVIRLKDRNIDVGSLTHSNPVKPPQEPFNPQLGPPSPGNYPQLGSGGVAQHASGFAQKKLEQECAILKWNQGYECTLKKDTERYYLVVKSDNRAGHHLQLDFVCSNNYPQDSPQVFVEVDGVEENFNSLTIDNWTPQRTIIEIVQEALTFFN